MKPVIMKQAPVTAVVGGKGGGGEEPILEMKKVNEI